jgi:hypothetical protein
MQDNFSSYTTRIKITNGNIARFQAKCDELKEMHQIDFYAKNGVLWVKINEDIEYEMQNIKPNIDTSMTVSFSTMYPFNIIIDSCNDIKTRKFCTQKAFDVNKGYWMIAKTRLNKKIVYQ